MLCAGTCALAWASVHVGVARAPDMYVGLATDNLRGLSPLPTSSSSTSSPSSMPSPSSTSSVALIPSPVRRDRPSLPSPLPSSLSSTLISALSPRRTPRTPREHHGKRGVVLACVLGEEGVEACWRGGGGRRAGGRQKRRRRRGADVQRCRGAVARACCGSGCIPTSGQ